MQKKNKQETEEVKQIEIHIDKKVLRSAPTEKLTEWSRHGSRDAYSEIQRRRDKAAKKSAKLNK